MRICPQLKSYTLTIFWLRDKLHYDTAPIPFSNFIHRDYFPAKAPGHIVGWPRQVTQPHFIAGPLGVRQQAPKEHNHMVYDSAFITILTLWFLPQRSFYNYL
jgi:hypothetical protein